MAMKQVTFVFATGASWLDRLVTWVTRSPWSHVAMRFDSDDILVEALAGRGFLIQPGTKYNKFSINRSIQRHIPELVYDEMLVKCRRWEQEKVPYGYTTCLLIGVKEVFGLATAKFVLAMFPWWGSDTMICSELIINLWRQAESDFLQGQNHRLVCPDELYRALLQQPRQDVGTKLTNREIVPIIVEEK